MSTADRPPSPIARLHEAIRRAKAVGLSVTRYGNRWHIHEDDGRIRAETDDYTHIPAMLDEMGVPPAT
ncbi:MAG: hypothetical protein OXU74_06610 [Gemmatimonadota bacterium]|nr:hypothetical protein [Gemmatimonadota bacterium]